MLPEIERCLDAGQRSFRGFVEGAANVVSESELAQAGFGLSIFKNLNTREDYLNSL